MSPVASAHVFRWAKALWLEGKVRPAIILVDRGRPIAVADNDIQRAITVYIRDGQAHRVARTHRAGGLETAVAAAQMDFDAGIGFGGDGIQPAVAVHIPHRDRPRLAVPETAPGREDPGAIVQVNRAALIVVAHGQVEIAVSVDIPCHHSGDRIAVSPKLYGPVRSNRPAPSFK